MTGAETGAEREVWITGIGLVSSLGIGREAHEVLFTSPVPPEPKVDETRFAPYPIHPLAEVDFSQQIPKKGDQRQMGPWQRIGVFAAGLALEEAGIKENADLLARTDLIVAAGNGERDVAADAELLLAMEKEAEPERWLAGALPTALRPTLYLAELSNLLAGNISIVHKVSGASRTYKGEEISGLSTLEIAQARITHGESDIILVGGAYNAEREDQLLIWEIGAVHWRGSYAPVWARAEQGGGMITGSCGAFLVLEAADHAQRRGAKPYARLMAAPTNRADRRTPGAAGRSAQSLFSALGLPPGSLPVLSGASGVLDATQEERDFLMGLSETGVSPVVRAYGSLFGHTVEAHAFLGVALGALAMRQGSFLPPLSPDPLERPWEDEAPERILVTSFGHLVGEGLALLAPVMGRERG